MSAMKASAKRLARQAWRTTVHTLGPSRASMLAGAGGRLLPGTIGRRVRGQADALRVDASLAAGEVHEARQAIDRLYAASPTKRGILLRRAAILRMDGEVSEAARMLVRARLQDPEDARLEREDRLIATLVETSPGWLPRIAGPSRPVEPRGGAILHLLKESAPELTNGFTMRSQYNLVAAHRAGLHPEVVTSIGFPRTIGVIDFPRDVEIDGIPYHRLDPGPFYPEGRSSHLLLADQAFLAAEVAVRVAPSVIHASSGFRGYETALVGLALRDHIQRPMVYEVRSFFESTWSQDERINQSGELFDRRMATETRAMRSADHILTIAETMRADIIARGVDPDRVTLLPNGVDADFFSPKPADPDIRERHAHGADFVFGYVSNLDHRRENQELLVEATSILLKRGRKVVCLIVGDGTRRAELEQIARDSGVGAAVVFTGRIPHDQVRDYYAVLDAFVVPRRDERASATVTPLKPYEALAMERPLVVADLPALAEIADPDRRGLAFRPGDAGHLADQLERLMDDPALARRLGVDGRRWVATERSWASNGERLREVYAEVEARWAAGLRGSAS